MSNKSIVHTFLEKNVEYFVEIWLKNCFRSDANGG